MRIPPKLKIVALALGAFIAAASAALYGLSDVFSDSMCGNQVIEQITSPDNRFKAVVFERDCGATTGFSTQVSLLRESASLGNSKGDLFIADTNHGSAPSGPGGGPQVSVRWVSSSELVISHHVAARVFKAERQMGQVVIKYTQSDD